MAILQTSAQVPQALLPILSFLRAPIDLLILAMAWVIRLAVEPAAIQVRTMAKAVVVFRSDRIVSPILEEVAIMNKVSPIDRNMQSAVRKGF